MNTGHLDVRLASGHPDAFCTPCERDVKIVGEESHLSSAKTKKLWGNLSERLSFTAKSCIVQHIPVSGNPNRSSKMPGGFRCYPKLALSSPITQAHPQKPQRLPQTVGSSGFSVETVCKTVKCVWCLVFGDGWWVWVGDPATVSPPVSRWSASDENEMCL